MEMGVEGLLTPGLTPLGYIVSPFQGLARAFSHKL